jgi:histidinol dehydrogenase
MTDLTMTRLDAAAPDFKARLAELLAFNDATDSAVQNAVSEILAGVRARGDAAVLEYTARFDRLNAPDMAALELPRAELHAALEKLPLRLEKSLKAAADRVRAYHEKQRQESWTYTEPDGTVLGQQVTPLDRVGLYVPGGKAAYPSSVLMNAIPAKVAGVPELIMVVPTPDGVKNDWSWRRPPSRAWTASSPSAAPRPWPPWPTAPRPCRPGGQDRRPRQRLRRRPPSAGCSASSAST